MDGAIPGVGYECVPAILIEADTMVAKMPFDTAWPHIYRPSQPRVFEAPIAIGVEFDGL